MANKYRGVIWNNAGAGPKVRIRRSIWLAELQDFGAITDAPEDLPTRGALHRGSLGATSGTRSYVNLSTVNDLAVVDTQDHGLITDTAISAAIWKTNPENDNDTGLYTQPASDGPFVWFYGDPSFGSMTGQQSTIPQLNDDSQGTAWNPAGTSFYHMHGSDTISEWTKADYKIHTPGQFPVRDVYTGDFPPMETVGLSTFRYTSISASNATNTLSLNADSDAFAWNDDGTKLYVWRDLGGASDAFAYVDTYTVSTAWDISTASYTTATQIEANSGSNRNPKAMTVFDTGSKLAISYEDLATDGVRIYDLSTDWDCSTASYNTVYKITSTPVRTWHSNSTSDTFDGHVNGLHWAGDGTQLWTCDPEGSFNQWYLSTPFDLMTAVKTGFHLDLGSETGIGKTIFTDETDEGIVRISHPFGNGSPLQYFGRYFLNAFKKDLSNTTYGTHSLKLSGKGGISVQMKNTETFIGGQSSWGIDYWHKSDDNGGTQKMVDRSNQVRFWKGGTSSGGALQMSIYAYNSGSSGTKGWKTLTAYENNTDWHHISVQYQNGTAYLYVDGVMKDSEAMGIVPAYSTSSTYFAPILFGDGSGGIANDMAMMDIRVSGTTALYTGGTASFTVPSAAPTTDANTSFLLESNAFHIQDKLGNFDVFPGEGINGTENGTITFSSSIKPY